MNLQLNNGLMSGTNMTNNFAYTYARDNPIILITFTLVIVGYFIFFGMLGMPTSSKSATNIVSSIQGETTKSSYSFGTTFILIVMVGLFLFLVFIQGIQYLFSMDINAVIKNIFTPQAEIDLQITRDEKQPDSIPEIKIEKQVFNIPENIYNYNDAQALCKAYGAELANYNQIEETYNKGGEWCNYGWSQDQMILYPTQKETWNTLQTIKGHENDCGRPGVNGGYISNKNARFGVNCYGYKPEINSKEVEYMNERTIYPISDQDKKTQKKIDAYKKELKNILVSPFNPKQWSIL